MSKTTKPSAKPAAVASTSRKRSGSGQSPGDSPAIHTLQQKQRQENRVGKKVISGYFDPAVSLQLRQLGLSEGKTVQELLSVALNKLFRDHKLSEIA